VSKGGNIRVGQATVLEGDKRAERAENPLQTPDCWERKRAGGDKKTRPSAQGVFNMLGDCKIA